MSRARRGGYIAPALNRDSLRDTAQGALEAKIITGGLTTLMPPHPTFFDKLSRIEIASLASFIKTRPEEELDWGLDDI